VLTVLPHFVLRYRQVHPDVARDALLATHGGLSLDRCAVICHISPMALYRLVCALGQQSLVAVLTRCGLALPAYFLADEKHSHGLTREGLFAHDRQWSRHLAPGLHRGRQCSGFYSVISIASTCGIPAGAVVSGPRYPDRWL
jgi:hypothetical protein